MTEQPLTFTPEVELVGSVPGLASIEALSNETSVYAASPAFVRANCGPIANGVLDAVAPEFFDEARRLGMKPNIDVRVHRLNVGEYPAVPGWHCDGALRETYFGAPDVGRIPIRDTILATVSTGEAGVSNFEVFGTEFEFRDDSGEADGFPFWGRVNRAMGTRCGLHVNDGEIVKLGARTLHRCTPAKVRGWRLLFRMSMWHNDYLGDEGMIAKQQQVYIKEERGW